MQEREPRPRSELTPERSEHGGGVAMAQYGMRTVAMDGSVHGSGRRQNAVGISWGARSTRVRDDLEEEGLSTGRAPLRSWSMSVTDTGREHGLGPAVLSWYGSLGSLRRQDLGVASRKRLDAHG